MQPLTITKVFTFMAVSVLWLGLAIHPDIVPLYTTVLTVFIVWSGLLFGKTGVYASAVGILGYSANVLKISSDGKLHVLVALAALYGTVALLTLWWIKRRKKTFFTSKASHIFSTIFENAADGIALIDGKTKEIIVANKAFLRMLEIENTPKQMSVYDFIQDTPENIEKFYQELVKSKKPFRGITQYRTFSGAVIDVERSITLSEYNGHDVIVVLARNVSEQYRSAQEVAEEHLLIRTLLDTIPDVVYVKDLQSRFILVNKPQVQLLGARSEEEVLGKTDHDYYPKEYADSYLRDEQELLRTGNPILNKEESARAPNGEIRWLSTNKLPLRNARGEIIGLVGTGRDITYLKNIEKDLRERETQFHTLLDFLPVSLTASDSSGKILFMNKKFFEVFGYRWSDFVTVEDIFRIFIPTESQRTSLYQQWVNMVSEAQVHGGDSSEIEFEALCANGQRRYVQLMTKVLQTRIILVFNDFTEIRNSKKELEKERNLLRTLIDNLPDRIYIKDTEARFVLNNKAHIRALGALSQEEVVGKTDFDFRPHHLAAPSYADDKRVLTTGQILHSREERQRLPSGEWGWLLVTKVPIVDQHGNITGLFGISRDITELKTIEESLERERTLLRTLIDSIPDRIYVKDRESKFILNNKAHLAALGAKSQDEALGKTDLDFRPLDFAAPSIADDQKVIETGVSILNKEERSILPDGTTGWVLTSKIPLRNSDGTIIGLIGISRDITTQKHYEEILQNERNLLRTLIDTIPDRIFVKDTQGRFLINNKAHIQALGGKDQSDVYLKTDYDFRPKELSDRYKEDDILVLQQGQSIVNREQESFSADGTTGWQLSTKIPLRDERGTIIGLLGISRDITQLKKVELEREKLIRELQEALANVKTLKGLLPICANCKRIRDDKGYWEAVEGYVMKHSDATFTHGLCPDCQKLLYPNISINNHDEKENK